MPSQKPSPSLARGHPAWGKKARYVANDFFTVRTLVTPALSEDPLWQYGLVVKKKIGNAVLRNRIKRRLRAAFLSLEKHRRIASESLAHIVVVRKEEVASIPFTHLCDELKGVLKFYD